MDESGSSVDSGKLPENFDEQNDCLTGGEPSAGHPSMLSQSIISLSFRSQSSNDSYDTIFEPCNNTNDRRSEASLIDQPDNNNNAAHSSTSNKCHVSEVTQETMLLSPRWHPPMQVMDRSAANDLGRTSSSVYTPNNTPQKWSAASTESMFSLHEGRINSILISNRPSIAAGPETARTDGKGKDQAEADPSISENTLPGVKVQKIPNHINANEHLPEISSNPLRNNGKFQPLPASVNRKHEKPSSCCKSLSSCKSLPCTCCCPSLGSCCKMPSCSCSCCSLKWCSYWNCCSKKTCCSVCNCCPKWSRSCPKIRCCCPSCKSCSNAFCCWKWSCWNCNCCAKTSCWRNWRCRSEGSCCESWKCCSKGICCFSWNSCCKVLCCSSWSCCSKGSKS